MSTAFHVVITKAAEIDIEEAYLWWSENRSKSQADRWYGSILSAIKNLRGMPERCPVAEELAVELDVPVRQLLFGQGSSRATHRILFYIQNDQVLILRVIHSSQRLGTRDPNE